MAPGRLNCFQGHRPRPTAVVTVIQKYDQLGARCSDSAAVQLVLDNSQENNVCVIPNDSEIAGDHDVRTLLESTGCRICSGDYSGPEALYGYGYKKVVQAKDVLPRSSANESEQAPKTTLEMYHKLSKGLGKLEPLSLGEPFLLGNGSLVVDAYVVSPSLNKWEHTVRPLKSTPLGDYLGYLERKMEEHQSDYTFRIHEYHPIGFQHLLPRLKAGSVVMVDESMLPYKTNGIFPGSSSWGGTPRYSRVIHTGQLYSHFWKNVIEHPTPLTILLHCDWGNTIKLPDNMPHTVLRNAWDSSFGTATVVGDGSRTSESTRNKSTFMAPFGTQYKPAKDLAAKAVEAKPWKQRDLLFTFRGTLTDAKPTRTVLDQVVIETRSYLDLVAQRLLVGGALDFQHSDPRSYLDVLASSVFTLCPMGDLWESYRIYEAAELGSIPIVEDPAEFYSWAHPAQGVKDMGAPFIFVKDWTELPTVLNELAADPERITRLQKKLKSWLARFEKDTLDGLVHLWKNPRRFKKRAHRCSYLPWSPNEQQALDEAATRYFGPWGMDEPPLPKVRSKMNWMGVLPPREPSNAAACRDPQCAPPLWKSIECSQARLAGGDSNMGSIDLLPLHRPDPPLAGYYLYLGLCVLMVLVPLKIRCCWFQAEKRSVSKCGFLSTRLTR